MKRPGSGGGPNRRGEARPVVVLLLLVAAAAVLLFWLRGRDTSPDFTLGGPLFSFTAEDIEGLILTREGRQYRLDRHAAEVWSLTGAASDHVDPKAMTALLRDLLFATGGNVLPGTEPEDRRYDFNGPEAIRLTVLARGGRTSTLALGTVNPLTENHFASGAGRQACFPVSTALRQRLAEIPHSVQLRRLLPLASADQVESVTIVRDDHPRTVARHDGRWWLLFPEGRIADLAGPASAYHRIYRDRIRQDDRGTWLLAGSAGVGGIIHDASSVIVRQIATPEESAALKVQWGLAPPWRRIVLRGAGICPDPTVNPNELALDFGPPLAEDTVPVLRRDNVMLTDIIAVQGLEFPVTDLIHTGAFTDEVMSAAEIVLEREGELLVRGIRGGDPGVGDGRNAWQTVQPPAGSGSYADSDRQGFVRDLVVNLDRLPILRVLPPSDDPAVLRDVERIRILVTRDAAGARVEEIYEMGFLDPSRLPTGVDLPAGPASSALWVPATGQLLQVPDQVIVTARNIARLVRTTTTD